MSKKILYTVYVALMLLGLGSILAKILRILDWNMISLIVVFVLAVVALVFIVNFGFILYGELPF